jgi:heptosyltransferase-3
VKPKILVIRGGAIGDFVLTLPAIRLLREAFPAVHLEILGYQHIVSLATSGRFADASRSIEYSAMAGFFNPKATLDPELCAYFAGFQQIISYLYDPDGFFSGNLRRCGVKNLIEASPKIDAEGDHAVRQLAQPLERLALYLEETHIEWRPSAAEREFAEAFLRANGAGPSSESERPMVAIHPGSGGEHKNWPLDRWLELARWLRSLPEPERPRILLIGGEADDRALAAFRAAQSGGGPDADDSLILAESLPLPGLAALLARSRLFIGHDSGISHLAAAVGAPCVLLFGPTDPDIWAPSQPAVETLCASEGFMAGLSLEEVQAAVAKRLRDQTAR